MRGVRSVPPRFSDGPGDQPPETLREERAVWLKLGQLVLYRQAPDDLKLRPMPAPIMLSGTGIPVPSTAGTIPIPTVTQPTGS